ncbi:acyltransferase family protein [Streptomyces gibsoniae]|uniref:Acyltransferase family protein n=1 Tax=Streptomyces gibsoniae TaxID=3075529 RepID=A0ABU2TNP6_9ACTN|nr:acyltransferase family protein [Streptomyces sp. DSM 41699]MDT0462466.1 acyltransferase family protein [Streptomyces sp. DSM 41699]
MVRPVSPGSPTSGLTATPVKKSYRTLDGIRGAAALCIVVLHSPRLFGTAPTFLGMAVDLFFVLSGFVLAHAYDQHIGQGMTPLGFLRRRWARRYPL